MVHNIEQEPEPRFIGLNVISVALKVIAIIVAAIGIITAIASVFTTLAPITKFATFIGVLITAAVQVLLLWAGAELIVLLVHLEHNTFQTKEELKRSKTPPTQKNT